MNCMICDKPLSPPDRHVHKKCWFKIPLKIRQRWWKETTYSRDDPSAELLTAARKGAEVEEAHRH